MLIQRDGNAYNPAFFLLSRMRLNTRDPLLFTCPYSYLTWLEVLGDLLGAQVDPDWPGTMHRLVSSLV